MRYCYQKVVGVYFFGQQPIRAIILLSLLLLLLIPPYIASFAIASVHIIPLSRVCLLLFLSSSSSPSLFSSTSTMKIMMMLLLLKLVPPPSMLMPSLSPLWKLLQCFPFFDGMISIYSCINHMLSSCKCIAIRL